jgi:hypothetical protein
MIIALRGAVARQSFGKVGRRFTARHRRHGRHVVWRSAIVWWRHEVHDIPDFDSYPANRIDTFAQRPLAFNRLSGGKRSISRRLENNMAKAGSPPREAN